MEVIKPGRTVPEFFIATCNKTPVGFGCGAVLKVFPTDCFRRDASAPYLSFFCEHCGRIMTPDEELLNPDQLDMRQIREVDPETGLPRWPLKRRDNVPPWGFTNMPTREEFCKKNNITMRLSGE